MAIEILTIGKPNSGYLQASIDHYVNQIAHPHKPTIKVLSPGKRSKDLPQSTLKTLEADLIQKACPRQAFIVACDQTGQLMNNISLSEKLNQWTTQHANLVFLIGGAFGLHSDLLARANARWSLSPLTFPHELVRLLVIEQLYRSFCILNHHPYHK